MLNVATTRTVHASPGTNGAYLKPWVCPLPELNGCRPARPTLAADGSHVELAYTDKHTLPRFVPVFAAHEGVITYAAKSGATHVICLDHPGGWSTQYANLEHMFIVPTDRFRRRRKVRVHAGDVLGYAAGPSVLIRFTLARLVDEDEACAAIDPRDHMQRWLVLPWADDRPTSSQSSVPQTLIPIAA
ncbi:MAG: hypothetical protein ABJE66_25890 [Deltaproteobacteria bacterium]